MTPTTTISQPSTPTAVSDWARRVLELLRTRCGAAGLAELARATGLDELQVIDVLYALEQQGLVTPTVWRLVDLGGGDA
jgi:DNA-binding IclR family transcriptional regulator